MNKKNSGAEEERRREGWGETEAQRKMDGWTEAQYRPIMECLDRPTAGGRDWELLIGGEWEGGGAHSIMGTGDWSERYNTEEKGKKKQKSIRETDGTQKTRSKTSPPPPNSRSSRDLNLSLSADLQGAQFFFPLSCHCWCSQILTFIWTNHKLPHWDSGGRCGFSFLSVWGDMVQTAIQPNYQVKSAALRSHRFELPNWTRASVLWSNQAAAIALSRFKTQPPSGSWFSY